MYWIIDRFEGETAVLEHTRTLEIKNQPRAALPADAREGDALTADDTGAWRKDPRETQARAERTRRRLDRLTRG